MSSRKQSAQDRYDHILPFIQEAANQYYGGNLDRGFRHWAFSLIFGVGRDIQDTDVLELTAIDGADDFEIDGWFIGEADDDTGVSLFQSKRRRAGQNMGTSDLGAFLNAPTRIANAAEVAASRNEHTKELHDRLIEVLKANNLSCAVNLVWVTSGTLSDTARRHIRENGSKTVAIDVAGNTGELKVTLEGWDLQDLYDAHNIQQESDSNTPCDVDFHLDAGAYHQIAGDYRTLSMTVPVKQIIDAFGRHRYQIFRKNPRGPLGNKVNGQIKDTLRDPINRKRFHLLNNGITAICQSWQLDDPDRVRVRDFQIINGCQTTVTLWDARAAVQDDPNVLVTVKLAECPEHFAQTIASATNTQAALKAEDFTANEPVQLRIQREFANMTPPWFYQVKRGEWSKMLGGAQEKEKYRDPSGGHRNLTSKEVAQAVVAFAGFPGEAKDKIRHFLNKDTISSFAREGEFSYDRLYTDTLSAKQLLLPAVMQRLVWKQVAQDKADEAWLDYARFHIIWLIGDILRDHYRLDGYLFSAARAEALALQTDDWFRGLYRIAVIAIRNARGQAQTRDEYAGHREFFRTAANYRLMESNRRGAFEMARDFSDPMAALPA